MAKVKTEMFRDNEEKPWASVTVERGRNINIEFCEDNQQVSIASRADAIQLVGALQFMLDEYIK
jgi:hypothetical protein